VTLEYLVDPAAAGCPGEGDLREWVADAYDFAEPFVAAGSDATSHLRIEIARGAKGYRGTISIVDDGGAVLASSAEVHEDCDALVGTLARRVRLVVFRPPAPPAPPTAPALACDPCSDRKVFQRGLDAVNEKNEEQDAKLARLLQQNAQLDAELKGLKDKMDWTYVISAGALMTVNLTSNVGGGAWVAGEGRYGPLSLGLELRGVFPSAVNLGPYDFDVSQMVALATPCGRYSYFFGCVVAGGGVQIDHDTDAFGAGVGFPAAIEGFWTVGARIGVEVPFGESRFGARAWGEVLVGAPRVVENYDPGGYRWRTPDVSGFFGLGLVVRFGEEGAK